MLNTKVRVKSVSVAICIRYLGLALCLLVLVACDQPQPRTAPTSGSSAAQDVATLPDDDKDPLQGVIKENDIPVPSGELLTLATSSTVRLVGANFFGSGVVIQQSGNEILILTVEHAATQGIEFIELFSSAQPTGPQHVVRDFELVSADARADLALMKARVDSGTQMGIVEIGELRGLKYAYSSGCGGKRPTTRREPVIQEKEVAIKRDGKTLRRFVWETNRPQQSGRSGGPLLDEEGHLMGIATGRIKEFGYYAHLREISKYLIDNGLEDLVRCPELLNNQHQVEN